MAMKRIALSLILGLAAVAFFVQSALADITSNLLVHYAFEEGSGSTAADSSGNANSATLTNSPSWVSGQIGGALDFNGSSYAKSGGSVSVPDTFTVSAWVKPTTAPAMGAFPDRIMESAYNSGFALTYYNSSGQLLALLSVKGDPLYSSAQLPLNVWSHVAATFDGAIAKIYVNGVLDTTADITGTFTPGLASLPIYVGAYAYDPGNISGFRGSIDEARVYGRTLTAVEIGDLYAYSGPGDVTPPVVFSVATSSVTDIGATVTWTTDEAATSRVFYGTTSSYANSTVLDSATTTSHSVMLGDLAASTLYHFAAVSRDVAGNYATSSDYTFTTAATVIAPTIVTSAASSLAAASATLNGSISSLGGASLTQHGFAYGTGSSLSTAATTTLGSNSSTGAFQSSVSSLTCGTTYYARAYGTNSAGTAYGSIVSFATSACAAPESESSNSSQNSQTVAPTSGGGRARRAAAAASSVPTFVPTVALTPDTVIVFEGGSAPALAAFVSFIADQQPRITSVGDTAHPRLVEVGLTYGMIDPAVITLQRMLNADPDTVVSGRSKRGSPGFETTYFGRATEDAVKRFQAKHGLSTPTDPAYGYVGPATRAKLNELFPNLIQG